jgi:hypothetical protein
MIPNIGTIDKTARIIVGVVVLSLMIWGPRTAWGLLGLVPLVTGLVGFCPLYSVLKISTRSNTEVRSGK